ncbi:MAG: hypothetical protein ABR936_15110 [Bacteroidota bacterium]|jgi:ribosomal protein S20
MSRSIHHTKKSALKEFIQGNVEPIKEFSLKSDLKKFNKDFKKELALREKLEKEFGISKTSRKGIKSRNTQILSALKKVKKSLNKKVDKKYSYPVA